MKLITRLKAYILIAMLIFGNIVIAYAAEDNVKDNDIDYVVTVPKSIMLDSQKQGKYGITVRGLIPDYKMVHIVPVNNDHEEDYNFYMHDQAAKNSKSDVLATITQSKLDWNSEEVINAYEESDNSVIAGGLSAGTWKGVFNVEISLVNDPSHKHSYTSEITKQPTCVEKGEKTFTCICGDSYTEPIPATGKHNYIETITKEPTCAEEGVRTYTCEQCGHTYTEPIPATGKHEYTETITKEATCTEDGEKTYTCKCGDTYTEKIPAIGHNYIESITKEPTCTEDGLKTFTCEHCGDTYTEIIPALGHDFVDGTCTRCGEKEPCAHNWVGKDIFIRPSTNKVNVYGNSPRTGDISANTKYLTIKVPDDYQGTLEYVVSYKIIYNYYPSTVNGTNSIRMDVGSAQGRNNYQSGKYCYLNKGCSTTGTYTLYLRPGLNYVTVRAGYPSSLTGYSINIDVSFANINLPMTEYKHYCTKCGITEEHYTTCTDNTKDEYYFCEACNKQFRHRCKYDDSDISFATCEGGDAELTCIDDYYDTDHNLFKTCGETAVVHFNGLGHDWQPWIVQADPQITITPDSSNTYTFTKSSNATHDTYRGTIGTKNKSNQTSASIVVNLPENFSGTYSMPVSWNISSSAFTKNGYSMGVYVSVGYDSGSASCLNYDLGDYTTSVGTTSGSGNIVLKPGKNTIYLRIYGGTSLSTWTTITGSCSITLPHMPFYIFDGTEIHKCSRCNLEESHKDQLREISRVEPTCTNTGYIEYTCDECHVICKEILPVKPNNHKDEDGDKICDLCGMQLEAHMWKIGQTHNKNIKNIVGNSYSALTSNNFIVGLESFGSCSGYKDGVGDSIYAAQYRIEAGIYPRDEGNSEMESYRTYDPSTGQFKCNQLWVHAQMPDVDQGYVDCVAWQYINPTVYVTDGPVVKAATDNLIKNNDGISHVYKLPNSRSINIKELLEDPSQPVSKDNFVVLAGVNVGSDDEFLPEFPVYNGRLYLRIHSMNLDYSYDESTGYLTVTGGHYITTIENNRGAVHRTLDLTLPLEIYFVTDPSTLTSSASSVNTLSLLSDDGIDYYSADGVSISIDELISGDEVVSDKDESLSDEDKTSSQEDETVPQEVDSFIETDETDAEEDESSPDDESSQENETQAKDKNSE